MKRQTLRLLHYLTRARQVPLCSLEDTTGLFTGGITQLRMRYLLMQENSVKVHELTGEAMQTPSPLSSCVPAVRSCTPQAGTGGSSAGVLTDWREGNSTLTSEGPLMKQLAHQLISPAHRAGTH